MEPGVAAESMHTLSSEIVIYSMHEYRGFGRVYRFQDTNEGSTSLYRS